jgi:hypothetical protein
LLFHPGIWLKHLLVDRIAREHGLAALSMPVDSDVAEDIGADAPRREATGLRLVHETLMHVAHDVPYESVPAPSEADWHAFVERLHGHLQTVPLPDAIAALRTFARAADTPKGAASLVAFLTTARRRYEGERPYAELPVSLMSAGAEFRRFVWHLVCDAEHFASVYNHHLGLYRARHHLRTPAQPFPDLAREGDRQQLPFWVVRDGRRAPLYVQRKGRTVQVFAATSLAFEGDEGAGPEVLRHAAIRPRALTLTAFTRLCLADLFVHGIGGGRYDRVTDAVIRDYFGVEPPAYAVATATLHLPLRALDPALEQQALQRRQLEIQHNPERVLTNPTPAQQALIKEKWALIGALEGGTLAKRDRRQATQRIREINDGLARTLTAQLEDTEQRRAQLESGPDASAAATYRGYPYCFFAPQVVDALIEGMLTRGVV